MNLQLGLHSPIEFSIEKSLFNSLSTLSKQKKKNPRMPITRATSRASRGAAQAPSTIYTTYNEIVSMIQGGLPPRRAQRAPKRAREESEPEPERREFPTDTFWSTVEEISSRASAPTSTSTSTYTSDWCADSDISLDEEDAELWCAEHGEFCPADYGCMGSVPYNGLLHREISAEICRFYDKIDSKLGWRGDCPLCCEIFKNCGGTCWTVHCPDSVMNLMTPKKKASLQLNTLILIEEKLFC